MIYKEKKSGSPVGAAIIAVLALVGVGYFGSHYMPTLYNSADNSAAVIDSDLTVQDATSSATVSGPVSNSEVLSVVAQIDGLNLKGTIFNDPAFTSFISFASPALQPAGRVDPFAPLSGSATTSNPF